MGTARHGICNHPLSTGAATSVGTQVLPPAADHGQLLSACRCGLVHLTRMRGSISAGVRRLSARKASKVLSADTAYTLQGQPAVTGLTVLDLDTGAGTSATGSWCLHSSAEQCPAGFTF